MPFQKQVNQYQAPGVAGAFSSVNPSFSLLAEPNTLVSPGNVDVGNFVFVNRGVNPPAVSATYAAGYAIGFLNRDYQALITGYLDETSNTIPQGFPLALMAGGDFWAEFPGGSTAGQTVYADNQTGVAVSGGGASFTGSIAPSADGLTGVLTVTAVASGYIGANTGLAGTGVAAGSVITSQLSGTNGGVGTYAVSIPQTVASEALTSPATQTNWRVVSSCAAGEIAKISTSN